MAFKTDAKTLWQQWQSIAERTPDREAIIHWVAGEEPIRWTYGELMKEANKFSLLLLEKGIKRNDVCAIIFHHNKDFYPLYLGISGIGALPAVLAYPNPRLHPDKFRQGLEGMSQRSGLDWILTEHEMEEIIRPFTDKAESTVKELLFPLEWDRENANQSLQTELDSLRNSIETTEPFLLQHSSGTTGLQKPVVLSHKAVLDHVQHYTKALDFNDNDKVVSWLPLYHDMGLIGAFHLPLAFGIPSIQIDPFEWVLAPILMFEATSLEKATVAWLPNFAYNLLADKLPEDELEGLSLDSFRVITNASEPIRAESHQKFYARFQKYGLNKSALITMYGMAETTLAFTQAPLDKPLLEIVVDRQKLSQGTVELANENSVVSRTCVSSGVLIDGTEMKIVDENREEIDPHLVGEIAVKSVSMFDGYRNYPEKTAEVLDADGWYYTGDYGFIYEDELFVIGRKKDIIINAGKNIYPEDIEDMLNKLEEIIPGRIIAFGEFDEEIGTELVSVVAETKLSDDSDLHKLKLKIMQTGMGMDVNIHNIYLVPPRWLIKSSAGKPSRKANKSRILNRNDYQVWSEK